MNDAALVRIAQGVAEGDPHKATAELLGRYQLKVYHWCHRFVRDHEQALDLAQDVLEKAWQALGRCDGRIPFAVWLFVITRNRCQSAISPVGLLRDPDAELESQQDPQPGEEEVLEERESEEVVLRLMRKRLDPIEQDALWLRCYEVLPVEEITRLLDIPGSSGARGVLQSARRKLRSAMRPLEAGS
jgi:RNA polymerase sigma-70 factor (ECF subfamily)